MCRDWIVDHFSHKSGFPLHHGSDPPLGLGGHVLQHAGHGLAPRLAPTHPAGVEGHVL